MQAAKKLHSQIPSDSQDKSDGKHRPNIHKQWRCASSQGIESLPLLNGKAIDLGQQRAPFGAQFLRMLFECPSIFVASQIGMEQSRCRAKLASGAERLISKFSSIPIVTIQNSLESAFELNRIVLQRRRRFDRRADRRAGGKQ